MKIALVNKVYPTSRPGGMAFVCQDRARALVKLGHEVHVLTTGKDGHYGKLVMDEGVEVHHMPCKSNEYSDEFRDHCIIHCNAFEPEILHSDSFDVSRPWIPRYGTSNIVTATTLHGCCWGAYFSDVNLWIREGGDTPRFSYRDMANERQIMRGYDRVLGISRHEHWILTNLMGLYDARLVYNPLPDYFFEGITSLDKDAPRRFLCSAVSQHHRRGFHIAKAAAAKANVELVTVHDMLRESLPQVIDSCSGLILPTTFAQGMDLAVSESIVRRRPVYATATGSYQRETEKGGIYDNVIRLFALDGNGLAGMLSEERLDRTNWRDVRDYVHKSSAHAQNWLEAILG